MITKIRADAEAADQTHRPHYHIRRILGVASAFLRLAAYRESLRKKAQRQRELAAEVPGEQEPPRPKNPQKLRAEAQSRSVKCRAGLSPLRSTLAIVCCPSTAPRTCSIKSRAPV